MIKRENLKTRKRYLEQNLYLKLFLSQLQHCTGQLQCALYNVTVFETLKEMRIDKGDGTR